MKELILAALIAVAPGALHFQMLLGRFILEPVRSFGRPLNNLFNRFPAAASIAAGLFGASAYLWRGDTALAVALALVAVAALTFDLVASLESFHLHAGKRH
jgi:hypothetical protein